MSIQTAQMGNNGTQGILLREQALCRGLRIIITTQIHIMINNVEANNSIHHSFPYESRRGICIVMIPIKTITPIIASVIPMFMFIKQITKTAFIIIRL